MVQKVADRHILRDGWFAAVRIPTAFGYLIQLL
jgi:hypothetical protein